MTDQVLLARDPALDATWWRQAVVYQVYPRSFADSNSNGVGDLRGILGKLDYLAGTLGVDAIWCGPLYRSPQVDFGYDVSDHTDVDPAFGALAALMGPPEPPHPELIGCPLWTSCCFIPRSGCGPRCTPPPTAPEKPPPPNPLEPLDAGDDVSVPTLVTANPSIALEKTA